MKNDLYKYTFSVIGGDQRQLELIRLIYERGGKVKVFGFSKDEFSSMQCSSGTIEIFNKLNDRLFDSQIILLPIPYKNKTGHLPTKDLSLHIPLKDVLDHVKPESRIFLGKKDLEFAELVRGRAIHAIDIMDIEEFTVWNAVPSAEGAIQRAMEHSNITLHGSRCLVLGYGRIGKVLAQMLRGIGAQVTVEARKPSDLTWIEVNGFFAVHLHDLSSVLPNQDFIFNTIPHLVLDEQKLQLVNRNTLIIDLASSPGGVDFRVAQSYGIRARHELGLPGLVAPKTAAKYILDTVLSVLASDKVKI
ncbi:MAG: dipicolinate synthase subunit DpsA [Clostridia bacterium]|jgi:dipicolinate synthase subunit A